MGNKRTGYGAMLMFLSRNGHTIRGPLSEHEATFISLAAGTMNWEGFLAWLEGSIVRKGRSRSPDRGGRPDPPEAASG
jgi:prophage maintenance system killer protein